MKEYLLKVLKEKEESLENKIMNQRSLVESTFIHNTEIYKPMLIELQQELRMCKECAKYIKNIK